MSNNDSTKNENAQFAVNVANWIADSNYCVANEAELIAALNDAEDNGADDTIKIQQGTYYGNFVYASAEPFGVTIEGGYSDDLCTVRDVDPANTVLDGGEIGIVLALSAPIVVVNFVVDGLTIQNGKVTGYNNGGGIFAENSGTFSLTNSAISNYVANGPISLK